MPGGSFLLIEPEGELESPPPFKARRACTWTCSRSQIDLWEVVCVFVCVCVCMCADSMGLDSFVFKVLEACA